MKTTAILLALLVSFAATAAEPPLVTRHSSLVTPRSGHSSLVTGEDAPALAWKLPPFATLEGDILTIDVPESAARQGCRASAEIDLSPYDGVPLEAEIEARGERIAKPRDAWNGLKFQFEYVDPDSGETQYPNTASRLGDFPRQTLHVRDALCTAKRDARLILGLQDTSGKVVFDLSTLRIREGRPFWPVTNQTLRCAYSAPMGVTSDERRVTSEVAPPLVTRHLSLVTAQQPLRGVMSPGRDMVEDDFATLRDWGATLLRYQMCRDWGKTNANRDLAEFDQWLEGRLDHFERVVLPMCRKYGLRVVLDLHVTPGGRRAGGEFNMFFEREYAEHFIAFWRRTAERFRGNADVIYGYDLCNEPVQHSEALPECDYWNLQRRAAEAIREIDPETPIIVEANNWDVPSNFSALSPLALTNVIYEVHVYNPAQYTHQGVFRPVDEPIPYPCADKGWNKDYLRRILIPVRAFEKRHGAKIYVGEFSAAAWAPGAGEYLRDCTALFNEFGWDWTYHAFRESPCWSVEHEGSDARHLVPSADNPRKRALQEGLRSTPSHGRP